MSGIYPLDGDLFRAKTDYSFFEQSANVNFYNLGYVFKNIFYITEV